MEVLELRFPYHNLTTRYAASLSRLLSGMKALQAVLLVALTITMDVVAAVLRTPAIYSQCGEHSADTVDEIVQQCLYNGRTGEFVATREKWYGPWPMLPVTSVAFQVSSTNQMQAITAAWQRAQSVFFGTTIEGGFRTLVVHLVAQHSSWPYASRYAVANRAVEIELERRDAAYLNLGQFRAIAVRTSPAVALALDELLPYYDMQFPTAPYRIICAPGFQVTDFEAFSKIPAVRTLQFDGINTITSFLDNFGELLTYTKRYYTDLLAISGWIDDTVDELSVPHELSQLPKLKYVLLLGNGQVKHGSAADFKRLTDPAPCFEAAGIEQSNAVAAACLSNAHNKGPYTIGTKCSQYDKLVRVNVSAPVIDFIFLHSFSRLSTN